MKKIVVFWVFIFAAGWMNGQSKPSYKVVATASIFADMVSVISGGQVDVESIVPIGGDPHIHEPTPRDARIVAEADLILKNGLTFEGWLNELIENSGTNAEVVLITEGIEPITSMTYQNSADPHAWMDAQNGIIYIENIKEALSKLDPEHADIYQFNYQLYKQQLEDLDAWIAGQIELIPPQKRVLITSHDAFQYYGRRYGVQLEAILGTSTDAEAQTSDLMRINQVIQENEVPAVFIETTVNPKLLEQIAKDNEVVIGGKLFSDSIGDETSAAPSYLDMLRHNTTTIVKALTAEQSAAEEDTGTSSSVWFWILLGVALIGGFMFLIVYLNRQV
jgi:zinc/manganese transport system substrate-binding protein